MPTDLLKRMLFIANRYLENWGRSSISRKASHAYFLNWDMRYFDASQGYIHPHLGGYLHPISISEGIFDIYSLRAFRKYHFCEYGTIWDKVSPKWAKLRMSVAPPPFEVETFWIAESLALWPYFWKITKTQNRPSQKNQLEWSP